MQLSVGQPIFGDQHFRFLGCFDEGATRVRCRTITFQRFEASVERITMPLAAIERPNGHQALGGLAGAAYLAIFADMAELDHHRLFKGLVVHHGRNVKRPNWLQLWRGSCAQTSQDPLIFRLF